MSQSMPENIRILRLFAANQEKVQMLIEQSKERGGVIVESMTRGAETLVLLEATTKSGPATSAALSGWQEKFKQVCEGAFYGTGETTLTEETIKILANEKLFFVCSEQALGQWVSEKTQHLSMAKEVFDFGEETYFNSKSSLKIAKGSRFANKYSTDTVQQIAGRVKAAYNCSDADYVLSACEMDGGNAIVFVGGKKGFFVRNIKPEENYHLWVIDIMRRISLDVPQISGTYYVKYGDAIPEKIYLNSKASMQKNACENIDVNASKQQNVLEQPIKNDEPSSGNGVITFGANAENNVQTVKKSASLNRTKTIDKFDVFESEDFADEEEKSFTENSAGRYVFALFWVILFSLVALVFAYYYTGGDISELWNSKIIEEFAGSNATYI